MLHAGHNPAPAISLPIWSCSVWGLPCPGTLLPGRCALTAPFHPYRRPCGRRRYVLCCTFRLDALKRPSRTLSGTLLYGVRTFLFLPAKKAITRSGIALPLIIDAEKHSAISIQHSARLTAWCCFKLHPFQQGCSDGNQNLETTEERRGKPKRAIGSWQLAKPGRRKSGAKKSEVRRETKSRTCFTTEGTEEKSFRHRFTRISTDFKRKPVMQRQTPKDNHRGRGGTQRKT